NLARKMEDIKTNEVLGFRTAGSDAEIQTGDMLYQEMIDIGLQGVTKDEFTLDTWTFEQAKMYFTDGEGERHEFELGGYQTNFNTFGEQEFELVYANKGTAADYENLDVEGKLVLVDINQRDEWWINYPALQAHLKGAAAIIAVQDGGYSEISDEALNTQDFCGPDDAPAFSMSKKDANVLKNILVNEESVTVTFDALSEVSFDGTSYNVFGTIPGKDSDSMILLSAHMDSYYTGFQDDNAAIGIMMGIAKAIVESGYQPEKTLVFTALAAEEWGVSNTRYDWSTGAYNQIFRVRPEWVGKVVANINFELPAYECESVDYIRSVYEYNTFLSNLIKTVPVVEGVYEDGIAVVSPTQTWSDDFSFAIAGVPAMRNEFSGDFMSEIYHSQFDTAETYNELAYLFHHQLYTSIVLAYDQLAVAPMNFETRLEALEQSINTQIMNQYDIDTEELLAGITSTKEVAAKLYKQVEEINHTYQNTLISGNKDEAAKLYEASKNLNAQLLEIFKFCEDEFVRLTWEDENIFPHEKAQLNIENINKSIEALTEGDVVSAIDDYLYQVDNNWYAYDFDEEVFNYFTNYVLDQPADRLMWGAGRVQGHENLFETIKSLQDKYEEE
ncbi:MAG: M28 family peptidase, partial [Turicibacter sp.]